jgi:uncharacterized membrane protein YfcA
MKGVLASPLGFAIGFALGALGGGGSILAVPALVYAAGQGARDAVTTSLLVVGGAAAFGLIGHGRAGRVRWAPGLVFGLVGIGGSLLAAFSLLILVAAWRMLTGCPSCTRVGEAEVVRGPTGRAEDDRATVLTRTTALTGRRVIVVAAAGTAVGFLTGLFGVGGGFVIVPALTLALGFTMPEAIGTSLLVITINALVALAARGGPGAVVWPVAVPFSVAALAGVATGVRAANHLPARTLLRWFAALLVGVALVTGVQVVIGFARS